MSLKELKEKYYQQLFTFSFNITGNEEKAREITTQAFEKLQQRVSKIELELENDMKSFLYKNVADDSLKSSRNN